MDETGRYHTAVFLIGRINAQKDPITLRGFDAEPRRPADWRSSEGNLSG
jgi:hypothetical protein